MSVSALMSWWLSPCLFVSLLIRCEWLCALVSDGWIDLLCCQVAQISPCSKSCTLCGAAPRRILRIRSVPIQDNFFYPFVDQTGLPSLCHFPLALFFKYRRSQHTTLLLHFIAAWEWVPVSRAALNALGEGLNCACASLSENLSAYCTTKNAKWIVSTRLY